MTIGRKVYSKEFKLEAIKMVLDQGINSTEVGRQLGVDGSSVRNWIKIYSDKKDESFPGSGKLSPNDQEIKRLKDELKTLKMERYFLKKTAMFFARE